MEDSDVVEARPIGTEWTAAPRECSDCHREFQALCRMTDDSQLCISCQIKRRKASAPPNHMPSSVSDDASPPSHGKQQRP